MYRSQYENEYGELWVFVYNYSANTGILTGADVHWQDYPVVNGRAIGLLLNDGELVWLTSAWESWESAIKGPQNPDRSNGGSASEQHDLRPLH